MHSVQVSGVHTACYSEFWLELYLIILSTSHGRLSVACSSSQPKNDTLPALDVLKEYLGLLHEFPDTTDMYKGCSSKVRDCERMKEEGRIDVSVVL